MKIIVVLGGGTAGWLTALSVMKCYEDNKIILIESDTIGILGAGEGSTPNLTGLLKSLDIDTDDFLKKTNSTLKKGIDFINWKGNGDQYLHEFVNHNNKGYHFDARLVADYLKNIAIKRGISHIIGDVINFEKRDDGSLKSLNLNNGVKIKFNLIFDCSGFARRVLGKEMNGEWIDTSEYLTANSALPFFLPMENNLNFNTVTTTNAISMKYGWMWQIPLQHRWGCGYVFDDKYINSEQAKMEVEEYLGRTIESNRVIKFKSGYFKNVWIKNCVAIGLSSSFFEPLEATSIEVAVHQLNLLTKIKDLEIYNRIVESINIRVLSFLRHHYMCDRKDTEFWKGIKNNKIPNLISDCYDSKFYLKDFKLKEKLLPNKFEKINDLYKIYGSFTYEQYHLIEYGNRLVFTKKLF